MSFHLHFRFFQNSSIPLKFLNVTFLSISFIFFAEVPRYPRIFRMSHLFWISCFFWNSSVPLSVSNVLFSSDVASFPGCPVFSTLREAPIHIFFQYVVFFSRIPRKFEICVFPGCVVFPEVLDSPEFVVFFFQMSDFS